MDKNVVQWLLMLIVLLMLDTFNNANVMKEIAGRLFSGQNCIDYECAAAGKHL